MREQHNCDTALHFQCFPILKTDGRFRRKIIEDDLFHVHCLPIPRHARNFYVTVGSKFIVPGNVSGFFKIIAE